MENCKVEFIQDGQKMIVDFKLDGDELTYTVGLEPKEYDPKKDYGLSGKLFTMFMDTLVAQTTEIPEDAEISDMQVNEAPEYEPEVPEAEVIEPEVDTTKDAGTTEAN